MLSGCQTALLLHMYDSLIVKIPVFPHRRPDFLKGPWRLSVDLKGLDVSFVLHAVHLDVVAVMKRKVDASVVGISGCELKTGYVAVLIHIVFRLSFRIKKLSNMVFLLYLSGGLGRFYFDFLRPLELIEGNRQHQNRSLDDILDILI